MRRLAALWFYWLAVAALLATWGFALSERFGT